MKRMILAGLFASMMLAAIPVDAAEVNWRRSATQGGEIFSWSGSEIWEWENIGVGAVATTGWGGQILPAAGDDVAFHLSYPANWDAPIATTVNYDVSTPITFNSVTVTNYDLTPVILTINDGYAFSTNNLTVGARGTLALHGGTLTTSIERIDSQGYFLHTSGVNTISDSLYLDRGTYELIGGALGARNEFIGGSSGNPGYFLQTGGINSVGYELSLSDGTYSLGGGSLEAVLEFIGKSNAGVFNQTGGTNKVRELYIANGRYDLSGGTLDGGYVAIKSLGIFNQTGGTNNTLGVIDIGYSVGSNGSYYLSGGTLLAGEIAVGTSGTGIFGHTGGTSRLDELYIGYDFGGSGTYTLNGMGSAGFTSLTAEFEIIGYNGTGVFNQISSNDGVHTVGELYLGYNEAGEGTYNMSGHALLAAGDMAVGRAGNGLFTQNRGTNLIGAVTIGGVPTGTGTLTIGELLGSTGVYSMDPIDSALPELWASTEVIGNYGTGTFTQYGGTNTVAGDLYLGRFAGGSGTYTLSGFSEGFFNPFGPTPPPTVLSAANEHVGKEGTGIFDQTGGTNRMSGDLRVGGSGAGTYNLSGGTLFAANVGIGTGTGTGTFLQSSGNFNVSDILTVGANGTYALTGIEGPGSPASLITGGIINNGTFNYSGGILSIYRPQSGPPPYPPDPDFTNNGTLNISGTGERRFFSPVINNGTVKTTDTTVIFSGNFINNGAYLSDPSTNIFNNLTVGAAGYLAGALGDAFRINGDLIVASLMNSEWNTSAALLEFSSGNHTLDLSGSTVDFHFGILQIDGGGYFSDSSYGFLSADVLNIYDFSGFLTEFQGNGIHINYGSLFAFNADGSAYDVTGEQLIRFASLGFLQAPGTQAPVPEPSTMLLLGSGLAGLAGYGRRRIRKN